MSKGNDKSGDKLLRDITLEDDIDVLFGDDMGSGIDVIAPKAESGKNSDRNPRSVGIMTRASSSTQPPADYNAMKQVSVEQNVQNMDSRLLWAGCNLVYAKKRKQYSHEPVIPEPRFKSSHVPIPSSEYQPAPNPITSSESDDSLDDLALGKFQEVHGKRTTKTMGSKRRNVAKTDSASDKVLCDDTGSDGEKVLCDDTGFSSGTSAPLLDDQFSNLCYYEKSSIRFLELAGRKVVVEAPTHLPNFKTCKFRKYSKQLRLATATTNFLECDRELVNGFYSNLLVVVVYHQNIPTMLRI